MIKKIVTIIAIGCFAGLQAVPTEMPMLTQSEKELLVQQLERCIAEGDSVVLEQVCEQLASRSLQIEHIKADDPCWAYVALGVLSACALLGGIYLYTNHNGAAGSDTVLLDSSKCACSHGGEHAHSHEHDHHNRCLHQKLPVPVPVLGFSYCQPCRPVGDSQ